MATTVEGEASMLNQFARDPDQALFRVLLSDRKCAEDLIQTHFPAELRHLLEGSQIRPANIPYTADPSGQTFVNGVFEIGGSNGNPKAVCMLSFSREWSQDAKCRLDGYRHSILLHYARRNLNPQLIPIVFHCSTAPGFEAES